MSDKCIECKYWMQTTASCVCAHPKANPKGNGGYAYHNYTCDINKFKKRELPFIEQMRETAKECGFVWAGSSAQQYSDHMKSKMFIVKYTRE